MAGHFGEAGERDRNSENGTQGRIVRMRSTFLTGLVALILTGLCGTAWAGQPEPWQIGFQEAATPVMEQLTGFHNLLLVIITLITLFVMGLLAYVMWRFRASKNPEPSRTSHNTLIEVVWTVVPVLILLVIAAFSFPLLYFMNLEEETEMTVIARGYQWYWGYEYPDQQIGEFTSFMVPDDEIDAAAGQQRLLSVDNPIILPVDTNVEILVTAGDVLHSFAVPAFGIKTDAVPGRMNRTWVRIEREGTYFGQCSELCGTGHAFMPIEIQAVSREAFDDWVVEQTAGLDLAQPPTLLTRAYPGTETEEADGTAEADDVALADGVAETEE